MQRRSKWKAAAFMFTAVCLCGQARAEADLLKEARQWRQRDGMAVARDRLLTAIRREDSSGADFERRIWKTNADKALVFPGAMAACTKEQRARTGIFVVLGFRQRSGRSQRIVRQTVARLRAEGWRAQLIEVPEWSSPAGDTAHIDEVMRPALAQVDRAILVGFSKGGWDWIHWLQGPAGELPLREREKVRLLIDFAAILRGSSVAEWGAYDRGFEASVFRSIMQVRFGSKGASPQFLAELARDPWSHGKPRALRTVAPRLRAIHYVIFPEGRDGYTHMNAFFTSVAKSASHAQPWMGPSDGMGESAAQILPRGERLAKWIVRVQGSHALLDGRYLNGGLVSRRFHRGSTRVRGGEEVMDDLLRALPKSAIGW